MENLYTNSWEMSLQRDKALYHRIGQEKLTKNTKGKLFKGFQLALNAESVDIEEKLP